MDSENIKKISTNEPLPSSPLENFRKRKRQHLETNRHFWKTQSHDYCRFFIENNGFEEAIARRINSRLADTAFVSLRQGLRKSPQTIDGDKKYTFIYIYNAPVASWCTIRLSIYSCYKMYLVFSNERTFVCPVFIFYNSMLYVLWSSAHVFSLMSLKHEFSI